MHDDVAHYREKAGQSAITTPSYRGVTGPLDGRAIGRWRASTAAVSLGLLSVFATVAAVERGFVDTPTRVEMRGGSLEVTWLIAISRTVA